MNANQSFSVIRKSLYTISAIIIFILLAYIWFGASIPCAFFFLCLFSSVVYLIFQHIKKIEANTPFVVYSKNKTNGAETKKSTLLYLLAYAILFCTISHILYYSWINGDDFGWLLFGAQPIHEKVRTIVGGHLHWVARHGDTIATLIGVSLSHWQVWILNAAVIAFTPFAFYRLLKQKNNIEFSGYIFLFFIFIFSLLLTNSGKGWWVDFTCFVAGTTYIWTSVATVFFLSYYNKTSWNTESQTSFKICLLTFILGVYSGWGTECLTVILLPILLGYCLYKYIKNHPLPLHCTIGLLGYVIGALFLFTSPAHACRAKIAAQFRGIIPENMTYSEVLDFVCQLTPEKLYLLGAPNVTLQGIPYHLHVFFFPYMADLFWGESKATTVILLLLITISIFEKKGKEAIRVAAICTLVAWLCASSYLAECIPSASAFVPPVFFLIGACGYVFLLLSKRSKLIISAVTCMFAAWNTIPSVVEASKYKEQEIIWIKEIELQKEAGIKNIILHQSTDIPTNNKLYLVNRDGLKNSPDSQKNRDLAKYFGVNSIKINNEYTEH